MNRSYGQRCLVARTLDVLGDRWTLLIVRELALGPRRYGDLLDALPGMGTSLLATRLKHLEEYSVLRRIALPGPGRAAAYELTDRGESLMPVLASLAEWGAGLDEPPAEFTTRAAWGMVAMRVTASGEAASYDTLTELVVDDEAMWVRGDGTKVRVQLGRAPLDPALRMTCARPTFFALARGRTTVDEAVESGHLSVDGGLADARRFFRLFHMPGARRPNSL